MKNTPFVRFRHGNELKIPSNIKESIERFIKEYEVSGDQAFRNLISDIADGSGAGISIESTWFQAIKELFEHIREYPADVQVQVKEKYVEVLQILIDEPSSEQAWNRIKIFFEENMDLLSLWRYSHRRNMLESSSPYRDKDGKVYQEDTIDDEKVEVEIIDGQTLSEARYGYITEDIYSKYGSVGLLLRLCRLVFIENALDAEIDDYSIVRFVMSEDSSGYNTWFLHGYWQVNAAKFARAIKWHPKDFYTDISWLESDLVLLAASSADEQSASDIHEDLPDSMEESDQILYQKSVEGYQHQYEIALDTNLFLSGENDDLPEEVFIKFEDRLLRWVNGSLHRFPVLIIPTNDEDLVDAMKIARKFISLLIFDNPYITIRESASIGRAANYYPAMVKQPRLPSITTISAEWINRTAESTSQTAWEALSFYKEANNSESIFYKFLNYYKIIQMAFLKSNGCEDSTACIAWIDSELLNMSSDKNVTALTDDTQQFNSLHGKTFTVAAYLQHTFRDAASHVGLLDRKVKAGYPTINPDNLPDQHRYQTAVAVIEELARKTIKDGMHS